MSEVKGTITMADGSTSEFSIGTDFGWSQWAADTERLGRSVDVVEAMVSGFQEQEARFVSDHDPDEEEPEPGDVVEVDDRRVLVQVVEDMGYAYRILGRYVADDETIDELADVTLVKEEDG